MQPDSAPKDTSQAPPPPPPTSRVPGWLRAILIWILRIVGTLLAGAVSVAALVGVGLAVAYPSLPDISELTDYRPKLPMRVYATDGTMIGEYGEERRHLTPIAEIPQVMKDAVLAIIGNVLEVNGTPMVKADKRTMATVVSRKALDQVV